MKQLFIVDSKAKLNGGATAPSDLSTVAEGAIGLFEVGEYSKWLEDKPTKDFAIAYGRPNAPAIVFPEINPDNLSVAMVTPDKGTKFHAEVTIPDTEVASDYTIVLVKKQVVFHERNTWTATVHVPLTKLISAEKVAESLAKQLAAMGAETNIPNVNGTGSINIKVSLAGKQITIDALDYQPWEIVLADSLFGNDVLVTTVSKAPVCDKAYIEYLASECAQNRGFNATYADGASIYPGYPMPVEDTDYKLYRLRFGTTRKAAKVTDEVVMQEVNIAVPTSNTEVIAALDKILKF